MKLTTALALSAIASAATARSVIVAETDAELAAGPITFTNCGQSSDSANVKSIVLSPNPPQMGKPLNIKITGDLKKKIEKGAKIDLNLKAGPFNIHKAVDLCEQFEQHKDAFQGGDDIQCPIEAANKTWETTVDLPNKALPAIIRKVEAMAVVTNSDGSQATCQKMLWNLH